MTDTLPSEPRMTRRRRDTRQRLIAAAYEVFTERGIRDSPVELICERAGFTRGAFYSNFATKEELFLALFQEENDARIERMRAALTEVAQHPAGDSEPLRDRLSEVGRIFTERYAADRTWYLLTSEFHAHALRQPELLPRVRDAWRRFREDLAELLVTLLDRIGLRPTLSPLDAADVLIALYENALHRSMLDEAQDTSPDHATQVISQVMATLMTPGAADS